MIVQTTCFIGMEGVLVLHACFLVFLGTVWFALLKFTTHYIECLDTYMHRVLININYIFTKLKTQLKSNLRDESFKPN